MKSIKGDSPIIPFLVATVLSIVVFFIIYLSYEKEDIPEEVIVVNYQVSDTIYSSENINFILSGVTNRKITIIAEYSDGKDHQVFTYPSRSGGDIKLKGVDNKFKIAKTSNRKGTISLYKEIEVE